MEGTMTKISNMTTSPRLVTGAKSHAAFLLHDMKAYLESLIRDCPPGELSPLLQDLLPLIQNMPKEMVKILYDCVVAYDRAHYTVVTMPDHRRIILSPYNHIEDTIYFDPLSRTSFSFNSLDKSLEVFQDLLVKITSPDHQGFRDKLQVFLERNYIDLAFPQHLGATLNVNCIENTYHILFVTSQLKVKNFLNGYWKSHWIYVRDDGLLKGKISTFAHSFEDGNVQSFEHKTFQTTLSIDSCEDDLMTNIMEFIKSSDMEFLENLERAYASLTDSIFKNLRRALPVTKTKMDWDKVALYKLQSAPKEASKA